MSSPKEGIMRKLLHAIIVVLGIVTVVGALTGCDKKNSPVGPSPVVCEDTKATNYGGLLPCTYLMLPPNQCWEQGATNYGGLLPCVHKPGEAKIGWVGFTGLRPGSVAGFLSPSFSYPGKVEARVTLNGPGTYRVRLLLVDPQTNKEIRASVAVLISGSGRISLPHDGTKCIAYIQNVGQEEAFDGEATFWYLAN